MGIALVTLADLFIPLQSLARRWMPARRARRGRSAAMRYVVVRPAYVASNGKTGTIETPVASRPLRVVRKIDAQQAGMGSRIIISGRMADVCAELDRLAALEAAAGRLPARPCMQ